MTDSRRMHVKQILADPVLRQELIDGAVDFICKIEGIGRHAPKPPPSLVFSVLERMLDQPGPRGANVVASPNQARSAIIAVADWLEASGHLIQADILRAEAAHV